MTAGLKTADNEKVSQTTCLLLIYNNSAPPTSRATATRSPQPPTANPGRRRFWNIIIRVFVKRLEKLNARASGLSSWSSKGFSNFFLQSLSLANLKGLGNLFMVIAASIRAAYSNVALIGGNSTKPGSSYMYNYYALIKAVLSLFKSGRQHFRMFKSGWHLHK